MVVVSRESLGLPSSRYPGPADSTQTSSSRMRLLFLLLALTLVSCAPVDDCECENADALVRSVAAPEAFDCGRARTPENRDVVLLCIEGAISRGEPFAGGWSRPSRETEVRRYVVQDNEGTIWMFGFGSGRGPECAGLVGWRCTTPLERRPSFGGVELACDTGSTPDLVLCDG